MGAIFDPLLGQLRTSDSGGTASPLTTKGDIYGYSTTNARIPVGADGTVLTADSSQTTGVKWNAVTGTGTVTSVSVVTANGVSGSVATATTTPAITLTLGAITPTSVNTVVLSGSSTPTLAVTGTSSISGANTGDQTITLSGAVTGSGTGAITTTFATPGTLTVSTTNSNANAHTHAITSSSTPGAAASLLATDSSGIIGSTGTRIVKGWFTDLTVTNAIAGSITGNAATVTTNANLTGDVTSVGNATTLTNAPVIAKVLTGYVSGAGTVSATDSILQAIQKLNGNDATNANLTGVITSVGNATSIASQTGTGTKFVVDTSPSLITPALGTPTALVGTNITGTAASFTAGTATAANGLNSATTTVVVNAATAPSSGQVLTASSTTAASWVTPGAAIVWTNVTGTTQSASINNGYIANNASLVTVTLPSTAAIGSIVEVAGAGAGGWKLAQNASQLVNFGTSVTTTGTGGSLASVNRYDAIRIICIVANTTWTVISSQGNITVV